MVVEPHTLLRWRSEANSPAAGCAAIGACTENPPSAASLYITLFVRRSSLIGIKHQR